MNLIRILQMTSLAEKYYRQNVGREIPNIDLPIETGYGDNDELVAIHCTKNGKSIIFVLDANREQYDELYTIGNKPILKPASQEEKVEFLQELDNLSKKEKEKHKTVIERIKNKLSLDIRRDQTTDTNDEREEEDPILE